MCDGKVINRKLDKIIVIVTMALAWVLINSGDLHENGTRSLGKLKTKEIEHVIISKR